MWRNNIEFNLLFCHAYSLLVYQKMVLLKDEAISFLMKGRDRQGMKIILTGGKYGTKTSH